jgi:hypothetical protein
MIDTRMRAEILAAIRTQSRADSGGGAARIDALFPKNTFTKVIDAEVDQFCAEVHEVGNRL